MNQRTLPIRIPPQEGEALDSWLEAIASRLDSPFGHILPGLGLARQAGQSSESGPLPNWTICLQDAELTTLAAATQIDHATLRSMTMEAYDGIAVVLDKPKRRIRRTQLWARGAGSRYCPDCLREEGGRWPLTWRLSWTFACLTHQRLLADLCPICGATPRLHPHVVGTVPQLGRCSGLGPSTRKGPGAVRCNTPLGEVCTPRLVDGSPILRTQSFLNELLIRRGATLPAFPEHEVEAAQLFADLKAVAGRTLAYAEPADIVPEIDSQVWDEHHRDPRPHGSLARPAFAPPRTAATTAIAVSSAVHVLTAPTVTEAAERLSWLIDRIQDAGYVATPTTIRADWGRTSSLLLHTILLKALNSRLRPSDQLRYRTTRPRPSFPTRQIHGKAEHRAGKIPQQLWPTWTLRIMGSPNGHNTTFLRQALAGCLLVVGSGTRLTGIAHLVSTTLSGSSLTHFLQQLKLDSRERILDSLAQLADYLDEYGSPIDYTRRRHLDYSHLLPREAWLHLCTESRTLPGISQRHRHARRFLFRLLTGSDPASAPSAYVIARAADRAAYATFVLDLTPELLQQLHQYGRQFLVRSGITGEPLTWEPPASAIALPADADKALDLDLLHTLIRSGEVTPSAAAERLGTTVDHVRRALEQSPAPAGPIPPRASGSAHLRMTQARDSLPAGRLQQLYVAERRSIKTIAALSGFPKRVISALLAEADIPIRAGRPPIAADPDWVAQQYLVHRRPFAEIAAELGVSVAALYSLAREMGIPSRPRGFASQAAQLAETTENASKIVTGDQ